MANEEKDGDQNSGGRGYAWQDQTPGQQSSGPRSQQRGRLQDSYASRGQQGRQDGEGQWNKNRQGYGNNNNSNSRPQNHSNAFHHRRAPRFENRDNNASAPGNSRDTTNYSGPPGGTTHLQEPVQVMRRGYAEAARSVTRAEEAPGAREEAPGAREEAPGAREEAPGAREEAPGAWGGAWGGAPGARDEAPGAREEAPGAWEEALVAREEAPGAREEAPGAREEAPGAQEEATGSLEEATGAVPKPREEPAKERDAVKGYKDVSHRNECWHEDIGQDQGGRRTRRGFVDEDWGEGCCSRRAVGNQMYGGRRPRPAEIKEVEGDLFQAPNEHSLAHCVAEDFRMGSGIAVTFSSKFQSVGELLSQRKTVGEVAVLEVKQRYVYYLVTKRLSNGKPTLEDLRRSVVEMRRHCVEHAVTQLALPRIGCGLDRLSWYDVKRMLGEVFTGSGVAITVYNFPQVWERERMNARQDKTFYPPVKRSFMSPPGDGKRKMSKRRACQSARDESPKRHEFSCNQDHNVEDVGPMVFKHGMEARDKSRSRQDSYGGQRPSESSDGKARKSKAERKKEKNESKREKRCLKMVQRSQIRDSVLTAATKEPRERNGAEDQRKRRKDEEGVSRDYGASDADGVTVKGKERRALQRAGVDHALASQDGTALNRVDTVETSLSDRAEESIGPTRVGKKTNKISFHLKSLEQGIVLRRNVLKAADSVAHSLKKRDQDTTPPESVGKGFKKRQTSKNTANVNVLDGGGMTWDIEEFDNRAVTRDSNETVVDRSKEVVEDNRKETLKSGSKTGKAESSSKAVFKGHLKELQKVSRNYRRQSESQDDLSRPAQSNMHRSNRRK